MNMRCGLGRQMRTAVTALSSTSLRKPERRVRTIRRSKTGRVAASQYAHRDIAAMREREAKDRLIASVPYVMRRQGYKALAAHLNDPQHTGDRCSLPCNTGPAGSGKTVLQRQNMLQAARDFGFLAVEIEFNGIQPLDESEKEADFARLVANRILCYLPEYRYRSWYRCLQAIAEDFEGKAASPLRVIEEAVQVLKKALNHEGPVLLAVDELVKAPGNGRINLSKLSRIQDTSLCSGNANDRIFLAVSVYNLVDLGTFVTDSKRELVHQQLPPILPLLLDSEMKECLPPWLQVFFNEERRKEVPAPKEIGSVATLLTESGGHPRRVEALLRKVEAIGREMRGTNPNSNESELLVSQLQSVADHKKECLEAMNAKLDLRHVGRDLSVFVRKADDKDDSALVLLKYLFTTVNMQDSEARILRSATTYHYQLVPHSSGHVGYLPLPALQEFCEKLKRSHNKEVISYITHAKGVADANLSATRNAKQRSTHFEMGMFHALCGAALAQDGLTEDMFRHPPENLPKTSCTELEWVEDVKLFPLAVESGKELRICDNKTLRRILSVGAVNKQDKSLTGLAFVPTDTWNTCDFVLVLPTADMRRAGRVVFAVQCKHWQGELAGGRGLHSLAYFRYGRHFFEADQVYLQKKGAAKRYARSWPLSVSRTACVFHSTANSFREEFCSIIEQNEDSDTRVVFVLATVNDVMLADVDPNVFNGVNLPDDAKYRSTALLEDEGLMDLQHMCGWCPTVGYGALLAEKVREFPFVPQNQEEGSGGWICFLKRLAVLLFRAWR